MARFPTHLTEEEKKLKKRYQKLREKRLQLKKLTESPKPSSSSASPQKRDALNPKDAKENARKLVAAGAVKIKPSQVKVSGFKRVGQQGDTPGTPSPKRRDGRGSEGRQGKGEKTPEKEPPPKPKPKPVVLPDIYKKTFVRSTEQEAQIPKSKERNVSGQEPLQEEDNRMDCTVCVTAQAGMSEDMLQRGFRRFNGNAEVVSTLDEAKKKAFVTFHSKSAADKAQQEMNDGRVSAIDIRVAKASAENGYVELPPEVESLPWVKQAASKDLHHTGAPAHKGKRTAVKYYDLDASKAEIF